MPARYITAIALAGSLFLAPAAKAEKPFRYPEAKHGKGELKYVNGIPVLTVEGTPEEIGEQIGILAAKPLRPRADALKKDFMKALRLEGIWTFLVKSCEAMFKKFPEDYRKELEATAKASGIDRDLLVVANTFPDIRKIAGCSTLIIEPGSSSTGQLLFGRNWDFAPIAGVPEVSLVIVYRPKGKRAFASIGFPVTIGPASGMNDAGLALAANEIYAAGDGSPRFDPEGVPMAVVMRRIMEECATVADAEKLLRSVKRTTAMSLTVADRKEGAVLEISPKNMVPRRAEGGVCCCTNHFVAKGMATPTFCGRLPILEKTRALKKISLAGVAKQMHAVNQGAWTQHTMIFEPAALKVHVSLARGPASAKPLKPLELGPYFKR